MEHGIMRFNDCGLDIGPAFNDDPTADPATRCVSDLALVAFHVD
jgi:hypothetical protein